MSSPERPTFFEGQYLGAEDLTAAVDYGRAKLARHLLGGHTWGIAMGLELKSTPAPGGGGVVDVSLLPGYAVDGYGRAVVVLEPFPLPLAPFDALRLEPPPIDTPEATQGLPIEVWLRYTETPARPPRPGFTDCREDGLTARVLESFAVEVGPRSDTQQRDPVRVAGRALEASEAAQAFLQLTTPVVIHDRSIAHQQFPAAGERPPRWLVFVGLVRWLPGADAFTPGSFRAPQPTDANEDRRLRRYAGAIAAEVAAPAGRIRLRDRTVAYSAVESDELAWVEGKLRIDGDTRLFGGSLELRRATGVDGGVPLLISRTDNLGGSASLRITIGAASAGQNMLLVGPRDTAGAFIPRLAVRDDGRVGIGTTTPSARLEVVGDWDSEDGALRLSGDKPTVRFTGGAASGNQSWILHLGSTGPLPERKGNLEFFSRTGPGAWSGVLSLVPAGRMALPGVTTGGVGVGTDSPRNPLAVRAAGASQELLSFEDPGGVTKWHINQNLGGIPGLNFAETGAADGRLFLRAGGNVGIGTATPQARLHVAGGAIMPAVGNSEQAGILFPPDPGGGALDRAYIRYFVESGENTRLLIGCENDAEDVIGFFQFGAERLTIRGGKIGIGALIPRSELEVRGDIRLRADGELFAPGGVESLRILRGTVRSDKVIIAGAGFSVDPTSAGIGLYNISFTEAFPTPPSASVTQVFFSGGSGGDTRDNAVIISIDSNGMRLKTGDSAGDASNRDFSFIVVGPR
jgi:hypothetical protein